MILSLVQSHSFSFMLPSRTSHTVHEFLYNEVEFALSILLEDSLKRFLALLQTLICRQRRADWPAISLALCLLFFGVESMQVDIHLRYETASLDCKSMEETAILMLAEIFIASTRGFNPLILDWDVEEKAKLVEGNKSAVEICRGLQSLSQQYCTHACPTVNTKYIHHVVQILFCARGRPLISMKSIQIV